MSPKEKADYLIRLMTVDMNIDFWQTKQCAINAVDEIIELLWHTYKNEDEYRYWNQVKIELEKL
jgi:hypothetical protein